MSKALIEGSLKESVEKEQSKGILEYLTDLTADLESNVVIRSSGTHMFCIEYLDIEMEFHTEDELEEIVNAVRVIKSKTC
jgi:hypothetical protein